MFGMFRSFLVCYSYIIVLYFVLLSFGGRYDVKLKFVFQVLVLRVLSVHTPCSGSISSTF